MFKYNRDNNLRMSIIGFDTMPDDISFIRFQITLDTLKELVKNNFADPQENQNGSPTISDFIKFGEKYKNEEIYFTGFAIPPERHDYSIIIEGAKCNTTNKEFIADFVRTFRKADELIKEDGFVSCWYD